MIHKQLEERFSLMESAAILRHEVSEYLILADQLKAQFAEIDDETLRDTLEGISQLPDLIQEIVRSSLWDQILITALKARLEEMQERLERLKTRFDKKRALACSTMVTAGMERMQAADFSLSLRQGQPRLDVLDEAQIPSQFLVPQAARLDRTGLLNALKRGEVIEGAVLLEGEPHIAVRTR
jgi:hypothetical protein